MAKSLRIVIVGDVHDDWDPSIDARALEHLKPDLVLFTGDFGDENVRVVEHISRLNVPKAAILGNHDCWWSTGYFASKGGNSNSLEKGAVQAQLQLLGKEHVGYGRFDFPQWKLSVVGGRPGSGGGSHIGSSSLAKKLWGIKNVKQSTERIVAEALAAPAGHTLIFLAHNGPLGLGSKPTDICGRDWVAGGGDHGDPDLEQALAQVKGQGRRKVPLVVFGHMHKALQLGYGERQMLVVGGDKSIYLNAAVVPRIKYSSPAPSEKGFIKSVVESFRPKFRPSQRNFTVVGMASGSVDVVAEVWVEVTESHTRIVGETVLHSRSSHATCHSHLCTAGNILLLEE